MEQKKNPLGYLEDLLDEEKESNQYFGHVDFWKYFEHIDVVKIYNSSSIEYRNLKLMVYEAVFYIIWLTLLTLYISENMGPDSMMLEARTNQERYWKGCVVHECDINEVTNGNALLRWMKDRFVPRVFSDQDQYYALSDLPSIYALNDKSVPWMPRYAGDTKTVLLVGNTRVRQLRVKKNAACSVKAEFKEIYQDCYAPFNTAIESTINYDARHVPEFMVPYFSHSQFRVPETADRANCSMTPVEGYQGLYPGEGFYFDIPLSKAKAEELFIELENWNWIDRKTRAVIVENTVVNPNTNIFVSNQILFEFGAYGRVGILSEHFPFRASLLSLPLMATDEQIFFMYQVVLCALFLLYALFVMFSLAKNGRDYFFYCWNLVDAGIITLFLVYFSVRYDILMMVINETAFLPEMLGVPEFFFPFGKLRTKLTTADGVLAFLGMFSWARFLKYLTLIDTFRLLVRTLERTVRDLVVFATLLAIVIFGFSVAFYVGFYNSETVPEFQTLRSSMFTLFFMLAKGIKLGNLLTDGFFPALVFIAYLLIVYFLLLNMFMAIVLDTYTLVNFGKYSKSQKAFSKDSIIWCFFISYIGKLKGDIFMTSDEPDEDRGNLDEQFIDVIHLPETLQKAWDFKRGQIRDLVNAKAEAMGGSAEVQRLKEEFEAFDKKGVVSRIHIQRLLDEDDSLKLVVGTDKAIDVIRRFRLQDGAGTSAEQFDAITRLQENVFSKLDEFDTTDHKLEFGCIETLKLVSTGLHDAISEIQNQWRGELIVVLEQTNNLAHTLTGMTKQMEAIQMNHVSIVHEAGLQQIVNQNKAEQKKLPGDGDSSTTGNKAIMN